MRFGFVGPSYTSQSPIADDQQAMNWYPELLESGKGKNYAAYYPTPGLTTFTSLVGPSVRQLTSVLVTGDSVERVFSVSGDKLYELFSNGTNMIRGTVATGALTASIATCMLRESFRASNMRNTSIPARAANRTNSRNTSSA